MIRSESFSVETSEDITIVRIADTRFFDTDKYTKLQHDLLAFVTAGKPRRLLVDLSNVDYCSTALTNTLLIAQKRTNGWNGQMKLFGLSEVVLETLQRLKLVNTSLSVCADEEAARQAVA